MVFEIVSCSAVVATARFFVPWVFRPSDPGTCPRHKQHAVATAGLLVFLLPCLAHAQSGTIPWYRDLEKASSAARESNKPLLIDFWADWCAPCRVMEKEVYADPVVVELASKKFLPVQLDFDRQQNLARKYNIAGLPTIVFTDSSGGELVRHAGIIDAKTMAELLRALPGNVSEFNRLGQVLA